LDGLFFCYRSRRPQASLLVSMLVGPHLAHIVRLRRRQRAANRRSKLRIEPPPCDQAPCTRLVVGPNSSTIRSSYLAPDARKRTHRARSQHECQKHSYGRCCGEARLHGLRRFLHVCRPGAAGCEIFLNYEAICFARMNRSPMPTGYKGCLYACTDEVRTRKFRSRPALPVTSARADVSPSRRAGTLQSVFSNTAEVFTRAYPSRR
jgi:hypothetical protein